MSRSASSVLIIVLLVLTFPIWIGIAGGIFGLIAGLFGAAIGVMAGIFGAIAGVFGAVFGIIGKLFGWLFGGLFNFHVFPHVHFPGPVTFLLIMLVVALIVRSNKTASKK